MRSRKNNHKNDGFHTLEETLLPSGRVATILVWNEY